LSTSLHPASPSIRCDACDAVCCRLLVILQPTDAVPAHLTEYNEMGLHVMARDDEGWCVAVDSAHMRCSIYESRPKVCRIFAMGGDGCRDVRLDYANRRALGLALTDH